MKDYSQMFEKYYNLGISFADMIKMTNIITNETTKILSLCNYNKNEVLFYIESLTSLLCNTFEDVENDKK